MKKHVKSHYQWLVIATVVVVVGLIALSNKEFNFTSAQQKYATMVLNFGDGKVRTFEGSTADKMTILEALYTSTKSGNIRFVYSVDESNDVHIAAIDDQLNNLSEKEWHFYLNGRLVKTEDINKIFIYPRAAIEARFE